MILRRCKSTNDDRSKELNQRPGLLLQSTGHYGSVAELDSRGLTLADSLPLISALTPAKHLQHDSAGLRQIHSESLWLRCGGVSLRDGAWSREVEPKSRRCLNFFERC